MIDKETRALVITWNGGQLPDYVVQKLMEAVRLNVCNGESESVCVKQYDGDGLSKLLVKQQLVNQTPEEDNRVVYALQYISGKYRPVIAHKPSFAIAIMNDIPVVKETRSAIEILATDSVPKKTREVYGISPEDIDIIKNIYKSIRH